jgi:hypothetical protein
MIGDGPAAVHVLWRNTAPGRSAHGHIINSELVPGQRHRLQKCHSVVTSQRSLDTHDYSLEAL